MAERRIIKELKQITKCSSIFCTAAPVNNDDLFIWDATILGPADTPYAGGLFFLKIKFPQNYPFGPPKIMFVTKIYHCNVTENGVIGLDILGDNWSPAYTSLRVLLSICALLCNPNPNDPKNKEAAKLYVQDRSLHDIIARNWTNNYAENGVDFGKNQSYEHNSEISYLKQKNAEREQDEEKNNLRFLSIKHGILHLFGEISLCHLVIMYDGEHRDKLPETMLNKITLDVLNEEHNYAPYHPEKAVKRHQHTEIKGNVTLFVKNLTAKTIPICIDIQNTVIDLKEKIFDEEGMPTDQMRIIHHGKQLEDDRSLASYGVKNKDTVYMALRLLG